MMIVEQRLDQLQKRNSRLTAPLTEVTMAATREKDGDFDTVYANVVSTKSIFVFNDAGDATFFDSNVSFST